jgi:hypothetical protein
VQVLKYHVSPGMALNESALTNGEMLPTLLQGTTLKVHAENFACTRHSAPHATAEPRLA